jgi:hypothetical protein
MKKLFLVSLALFTMTAVQAQLKVIPTLKKGMEKVYETKMTMIMPGQPAINLVSDTKYTVSDATADGYIIDVVTTTFSSDAAKDNITGQIMTAAQEMVKDVNIRIATDKNGKPVKIANYEELSKKVNERGKLMINKIYELVPEAKEILPEDALKEQLMESVAEESLFKSMSGANSPLLLFGKTIMTGAQEEIVNEQGLNMKRMYFVNGKDVTTNATLNMSKEQIKKLLIAQIGKTMPGQADAIKGQIDQLMESGVLKLDAKETTTYKLRDDFWPQTWTTETSNEAAGQETVTKVTTVLK